MRKLFANFLIILATAAPAHSATVPNIGESWQVKAVMSCAEEAIGEYVKIHRGYEATSFRAFITLSCALPIATAKAAWGNYPIDFVLNSAFEATDKAYGNK